MAVTTIIIFLANVILSRGRPEIGPVFDARLYENFGANNNSLERAHYNPWACNYRLEPGYKCLSCNRALHCYVNNFALLVQCAGIFPYCRSGFCSLRKPEGCIEDEPTKATTELAQVAAVHDHVTETHDLPAAASVTEAHESTVSASGIEGQDLVETDSDTIKVTPESVGDVAT